MKSIMPIVHATNDHMLKASSPFVLAGVMGWPVAHSRSPLLFTHWIETYRLRGAYVPLAIPPERLEKALRALSSLGFSGCNITIPHKESALQIVDYCDLEAKRTGAVNCVTVNADGSLSGSVYDGYGFLEGLRATKRIENVTGNPVLVVGAGGSARAVIASMPALKPKEIRITSRNPARVSALQQVLEHTLDSIPLVPVPWNQREEALEQVGLLVNCTNQGMVGQPPLALSLDSLPPGAIVYDIIYTPLETPLLKQAQKQGNMTLNGLDMLLYQACPAFHQWFGLEPAVTPALRQTLIQSLSTS